MVKEMPNLVGTAARPRLRKRLPALNAAAAERRSVRPPALRSARSQQRCTYSNCGTHMLTSMHL